MTPDARDREGALPRLSLDRRITVLVVLLTLLVIGGVAALRIPVELIPQGFSEPFLAVRVPWQDAPSREVLDKIALPLEEELSTVRGLSSISTAAVTGRGMAFMRFKQGTDMDLAYREVRDRVERARLRFPDDVDRVYVQKDDASGIPVYLLGLAVDPLLTDQYDLIQNEVILPLSRVDGVASVQSDGLVEKEILIELDREKTAAAGLNIYQLAQQLAADNFTLASGTVEDSGRKLLLRSVSRYDSLEALEQRPIARGLRLADVARIAYEQPERDFRVRAMSRPAIAVAVMKEGSANVREVSQRLSEVVERLEADPRLSGLQMVTLFSQGEVIDDSLSTLVGSGLQGGLIAAGVLFLFLRRARLTAIIALGIPVSTLIALAVMYFGGETLNILTLLGLMLCVGMLVDNSVVVAENIVRLFRDGAGRREACIHGAGEVGLAITMSTLTTIVVFLPVALVEGPGQFFLLRLAIPVCVSVAASLLVALVFTPLAVYLTLPENVRALQSSSVAGRAHRRLNRLLVGLYEFTFGKLQRVYGRILAYFLARRIELVLVLIAVFALTAALPFQKLDIVPMQEEERGGFQLSVEFPGNSTLAETEEWFLAAEKIVEGKKDELGLDGWFLFHRKTFGEIQGWFSRPRTTTQTPKQTAEMVMKALPEKPGVKITLGDDNQTNDEPDQGRFRLTLYGEDPDQLESVAGDLESVLTQVDGVLGVGSAGEQMPNELALVVDRQQAQRLGVDPRAVAGVVSYALRGAPLPKQYRDGREIPVRVRFREADRESLTELADFGVPTRAGGILPLSSVTDSRVLPTPRAIWRENKRISRSIVLELAQGDEQATRERLGRLVAGIDLPEGVSTGADTVSQSTDEDLEGLKMAGILSVVFIYLLMGFLFESFVLPLSILATIPLSIIGVSWIHYLWGLNIDMLGVVAVVLLGGVVVNNGIVLIDYVHRLRGEGVTRSEALLLATERRFRPILMTALTTIVGMVPLALAGTSNIGLSYKSFSLTLIGGMTTATALTLLVVPVFYTFFDDARLALLSALTRSFNSSATERVSASGSTGP